MNKVIILEVGHGNFNGNYVLDQYLPVDSIKTGIAIAKESIKEYKKPNIKIEHPTKQVWIITKHRELVGDLVRSFVVKEVSICTMVSLKKVKTI